MIKNPRTVPREMWSRIRRVFGGDSSIQRHSKTSDLHHLPLDRPCHSCEKVLPILWTIINVSPTTCNGRSVEFCSYNPCLLAYVEERDVAEEKTARSDIRTELFGTTVNYDEFKDVLGVNTSPSTLLGNHNHFLD
jgi:hypothetical protein